ncbi:MAG: DMT family transporter [Candidatus Paceibacterota bacterium]|jgi:drug/metabolite transporter (DMT)-like permease
MLKNSHSTSSVQATGPIFILIAATLWAFDGLIRQHLYSLPPITIIFFEHLFGLILLFPFVYKYISKITLVKKDWWLVVLISVLSGLFGTLWFTTALGKVHFISISVVFLLQKLQPIFAITTARIFLKEKLDARYIKWAVFAIISAYFVTFNNGIVNFATGEGTIIAALYALGAAFAWGSSTTFSKMLLGKIDAKLSTFYRFLVTVIIALPILFLSGHGSSLSAPSTSQFGWLALIAISTGMVALLIYYKGLAKTPVHISTILELTFPFIAIILDMIVNHTVLSITQWLAALILVFSIYKIAKLREQQNS